MRAGFGYNRTFALFAVLSLVANDAVIFIVADPLLLPLCCKIVVEPPLAKKIFFTPVIQIEQR